MNPKYPDAKEKTITDNDGAGPALRREADMKEIPAIIGYTENTGGQETAGRKRRENQKRRRLR